MPSREIILTTDEICREYKMETADGWQYEVTAAQQIVKVTQGKPKVTVLSEYGNTLYREAGDGRMTFGMTKIRGQPRSARPR